MPVLGRLRGDKTDVLAWVPLHEVEADALTQLRNVASLPWVRHVRAMPDVHLGKGATVGSVIAMRDAVSPNAVGVDIGCGMAAVRTSLRAEALPDSLGPLRSELEAVVPVGNGPRGAHSRARKSAVFEGFAELAVAAHDDAEKTARLQLGTLGGGNHFIELCLDDSGAVWLLLHSGSRNIGKRVAEFHAKIAMRLEHNRRLPDPQLAVFLNGTGEMAAYRRDLYWAQRYARENREVMLAALSGVLRERFPGITLGEPVRCHHNYVAEEDHFGLG